LQVWEIPWSDVCNYKAAELSATLWQERELNIETLNRSYVSSGLLGKQQK
jgi:hypothetical protein